MKQNLLVVDDEEHTREGLELALEDKFEVFLASSAEEAFNAMEAERFEVVLTDLRMAGASGMSVIDFAVKHPSRPICIMMTAYGEVDVAVEAMKRGAFDFLPKPINLESLAKEARKPGQRYRKMGPKKPEEPGQRRRKESPREKNGRNLQE